MTVGHIYPAGRSSDLFLWPLDHLVMSMNGDFVHKGYLMFGVINMPFVSDLNVCLSTLKVHKVIASVRTLHQPYESSVIKSEARIVLSAIIR